MKSKIILLKGIVFMTFMLFASDILNAQSNADGDMPQFLFPDFPAGTVKMKNGNKQKLPLNYNTITEKMVYRQNGTLYDMIGIDMVDTIYIKESKFIPSGKYFVEVLHEGPVTLFIQHKGSLLSPGAPAAYGGTSQVSNSKYLTSIGLSGQYYNLKLPQDFTVQPSPVFWIRNNSGMHDFLNEKQFLKIFPENQQDLKKFIKQNKLKFERITDMKKLAEYCNELIE
jgi:hypothetical protein